jgi:hypothetical protein
LQDLYDTSVGKGEALKRTAVAIEASTEQRQEQSVNKILQQKRICGITKKPGLPRPISSNASTTSSLPSTVIAHQPSIAASMGNMQQGDIRQINKSSLDMAIADFFHCDNIPDNVAKSPRLKRIITLAKAVGNDYKIPTRQRIGGELLDLNFESQQDINRKI